MGYAAEVHFISADTAPSVGSGEAAVLDRLENTVGHNVTLVTGLASQATDAGAVWTSTLMVDDSGESGSDVFVFHLIDNSVQTIWHGSDAP